MKKILPFLLDVLLLYVCVVITSCGPRYIEDPSEGKSTVDLTETDLENITEQSKESEPVEDEINVPTKDEVLAMRETALEGMSEQEKERLTENIKIANLQMEYAYMYENIFEKLSDPDSLYWQYFDQAGEIQLGWWYKGNILDKNVILMNENLTEEEFNERYEPGTVYNRFDGANFVALIQDMQTSVHQEALIADLQQLIDLTNLSVETHNVEYVENIYAILHDLDYYLLRYGLEDVGPYVEDTSLLEKYYGVLCVYGAKPDYK